MAEPKRLSDEELAEIRRHHSWDTRAIVHRDALLAHIAWLEGEKLNARTAALEIVDAEHAQSCHFLGAIAESTRTLLIEVVKEIAGEHQKAYERVYEDSHGSETKLQRDHLLRKNEAGLIAAALEAAELGA